jgi:hypothetical protein
MKPCASFGCSGNCSAGVSFCNRCWNNLPGHLRGQHLRARSTGSNHYGRRDEPLAVPILEILQSRQRLTNHA